MTPDEYGDLERALVDYLTPLIAGLPGFAGATVGVGLPTGWSTGSPPHVSVFDDGGTEARSWTGDPLVETATVRVTAWANTPTRAKTLARLARRALLEYPARPGARVVAAQDPDSRAPIASGTITITRAPKTE